MRESTDMEHLKNLFIQHNFVMTTAELTAAKLYYADIQKMLDAGLIEKVKRGYYHWIDKDNSSEVIIINRLFPDAVLCMNTALFYYRYSDRNPAEWHFSIDKNVAKQRNKNKMDREIFNKAVQNYVKDPKKNIPILMKYAKELRVQKRVKDLIGVWL